MKLKYPGYRHCHLVCAVVIGQWSRAIEGMTNMNTKPVCPQWNCTSQWLNWTISICVLITILTKGNDNDNQRECSAVIENVTCNVNEDKLLINPLCYKCLKTIHSNKATRPDNMSAFLLKTFAKGLTPAWHWIFQHSIDSHTVPKLWKKSIIIPIPKKPCPQEDNYYRPVALTSNVTKSLERLITEELHTEVEPSLDNYQFAYTKKHSTSSDAISTIMHIVLKHQETLVAYARLVFIDLSSASSS